MAVIYSPAKRQSSMTFQALLDRLIADYPDISFQEADLFYWSPQDKTVYYTLEDSDEPKLTTLLHETAHGLLNHFDFKSDFHLIKLESQAWEKTLELCDVYNIDAPSQDYIEDCIDTYRDWQYRRSICPECNSGGLQIESGLYQCIMCDNKWSVTKQRFCRPYRKKQPL